MSAHVSHQMKKSARAPIPVEVWLPHAHRCLSYLRAQHINPPSYESWGELQKRLALPEHLDAVTFQRLVNSDVQEIVLLENKKGLGWCVAVKPEHYGIQAPPSPSRHEDSMMSHGMGITAPSKLGMMSPVHSPHVHSPHARKMHHHAHHYHLHERPHLYHHPLHQHQPHQLPHHHHYPHVTGGDDKMHDRRKSQSLDLTHMHYAMHDDMPMHMDTVYEALYDPAHAHDGDLPPFVPLVSPSDIDPLAEDEQVALWQQAPY